ncbi:MULTISPECIES: hypothetical protein [Nonomuraea]|uniref:Uncharacterized protein n=1 Tax=Nonomuraea ferruginea TaxID=46174 RepID=A0ABT4SVQ7_9ACTN|nr:MULTISPECIES: hypothetical protein [Nonomuraea]MDA0641349.1 hypothetical protein [Nonomuraea ferruginea]TXK35076.1 hypothetical protein FR742_38055 [Nonomuraea sp. C10]
MVFSQRIRRGSGEGAVLTVAHGKRRFVPKTGMYAVDVSTCSTFARGGDPIRSRTVQVGRDIYSQGDWTDVPQGKKWVHREDTDALRWTRHLIEPLNPEFLRLISPGAKRISTRDRYDGVRTTRYDGSVQVDHLSSYWAGHLYGTGAWTGGRIRWKLWLGPDDLPRRFQAEIITEPYGPEEKADAVRMNVLYKGWRAPVRIQIPPENQVAEAE